MSYRPEITFLEGSNDISDYVLSFDAAHGVNIFGFKRESNRVQLGGTMILDNADDYWTPARIAGLGVIKMMHKTDLLMQALVFDYDYQPRDQTVRCELRSAQLGQYQGSLELNAGNVPAQAGMGFTLAEIVEASGLTITPEQPWATGLNMDQGSVYQSSKIDFLDDLEVAADGFVYEDHEGALRFMGWDDARGSSLVLNSNSHYIERDTAESIVRFGWRRDAQSFKTLDIDFIDDGGTFDEGMRLQDLGYWEEFPGVDFVRVLHMQPLREIGGLTYDRPVSSFAFHSSIGSSVNVSRRPPPFTGGFPPYEIIVGSPRINPENPEEVLLRIQVGLQGSQSFHTRFRNLWLMSDYRIDSKMYPDAFTETERRITTRDDGTSLLGERPAMPWPVDDGLIPTIGERVLGWSTRTPRVTRLCFSLIQQTEDKFNSLVRHRIGSVAEMLLTVDGLPVAGFGANLHIRWRYDRGRYSCVEMDFLELRELPNEYRLYRLSLDNPLFRIDDEGPLYREVS